MSVCSAAPPGSADAFGLTSGTGLALSSTVGVDDEAECRQATHILTLGPAAILGARRIVQSVVDADTAPGKRESYRRVMETQIANDVATRARQLDANPGLWIRFHANVRSLILPNVLS